MVVLFIEGYKLPVSSSLRSRNIEALICITKRSIWGLGKVFFLLWCQTIFIFSPLWFPGWGYKRSANWPSDCKQSSFHLTQENWSRKRNCSHYLKLCQQGLPGFRWSVAKPSEAAGRYCQEVNPVTLTSLFSATFFAFPTLPFFSLPFPYLPYVGLWALQEEIAQYSPFVEVTIILSQWILPLMIRKLDFPVRMSLNVHTHCDSTYLLYLEENILCLFFFLFFFWFA